MGSSQNKSSAQPKRATKATAPKTPLVLIHGFRGTRHGLQLISDEIEDLETEGKSSYAIYAPDLPGFGRGARLSRYTLEAYVKWLHAYLRTVQERFPRQKIVLLGHSFGSIICAAYAAEYPKTIGKLILVNPIGAPALEGPKKILTKLAITYYKIGAWLPGRLAHSWLSSPLIVRIMSISMAKTKDRDLRKFIHSQHDQYFSLFHSPTSVLEGFETSVSHTVKEFAAKIPLRTLLIAGALDDITPLGQQYALSKLFPDASIKVIDHVGHLTHYETPSAVARHVHAFIKSP